VTDWDVRSSEPRALGKAMGLGASEERVWRPEELGAILRHQLSAPVEFDLGNLNEGMAARLRTLARGEGLLLKSFHDLLNHPNPPIELLVMTKDFAKALQNHPDSPLPHEVAMLLYLASIVAALVRCGWRITSLDNATLRRSLEWFQHQAWVEEPMRRLLEEGMKRLDADEGSRHK